MLILIIPSLSHYVQPQSLCICSALQHMLFTGIEHMYIAEIQQRRYSNTGPRDRIHSCNAPRETYKTAFPQAHRESHSLFPFLTRATSTAHNAGVPQLLAPVLYSLEIAVTVDIKPVSTDIGSVSSACGDPRHAHRLFKDMRTSDNVSIQHILVQ